jgi:hypothetical protein
MASKKHPSWKVLTMFAFSAASLVPIVGPSLKRVVNKERVIAPPMNAKSQPNMDVPIDTDRAMR